MCMAAGGRKGGGRARGFMSETCSPFAGAWLHGHTQLQESLGSDAEPRRKGCRRIREQSRHTALGKKPRNHDHYFPRATAFDTAHPKITTAPPPERKAWPLRLVFRRPFSGHIQTVSPVSESLGLHMRKQRGSHSGGGIYII